MKKILTIFAILFVLSNAGYTAETFGQNTAQATQNIFNQMHDAILKDVQNTVDSTLNMGVNGLKLATYKAELAQKKQELKQVEASNENFITKSCKKIKLNQEIRDLEHKIADLEKQMHF